MNIKLEKKKLAMKLKNELINKNFNEWCNECVDLNTYQANLLHIKNLLLEDNEFCSIPIFNNKMRNFIKSNMHKYNPNDLIISLENNCLIELDMADFANAQVINFVDREIEIRGSEFLSDTNFFDGIAYDYEIIKNLENGNFKNGNVVPIPKLFMSSTKNLLKNMKELYYENPEYLEITEKIVNNICSSKDDIYFQNKFHKINEKK